MDVSCMRCGAAVAADDINIQALVAKCASCNAVFDIAQQVGEGGSSGPRRREPVELPEGMVVVRAEQPVVGEGDPYRTAGRGREDVILEWRWYRPRYLFLVFFAAAWWGFLIVWYTVVGATGAPLAFKLFPILHIVAGLIVGYIAAAMLLNRTTLSLRGEVLRVAHGPLRWRGQHAVPVGEIEQLYCTEGVAYTVNDRPVPGYNVLVRTRAGDDIKLVRNLPESPQALYIEQQIEEALSILDEPMDGELAR